MVKACLVLIAMIAPSLPIFIINFFAFVVQVRICSCLFS